MVAVTRQSSSSTSSPRRKQQRPRLLWWILALLACSLWTWMTMQFQQVLPSKTQPKKKTHFDLTDGRISVSNNNNSSSSSSSSNNNNNNNNNNHNKYYLQYFASGDWGDQFRSLSNAYIMAHETKRILVLPPVILQPDAFLSQSMVCDFDAQKFHVNSSYSNLSRIYLDLWKQQRKQQKQAASSSSYQPWIVRMDQVLDIQGTAFLDVETIDILDLYQSNHYNKNAALDRFWVMESEFSHFNTFWLLDPNDIQAHQGKKEDRTSKEEQQMRQYTITARSLPDVTEQYATTTMWTMLDTFRTGLPGREPSENSEIPTSFLNELKPRTFRVHPRLSSEIRQEARQVLLFGKKIDATVNKDRAFIVTDYVAIHLRETSNEKDKEQRPSLNFKGMENLEKLLKKWTRTLAASSNKEAAVHPTIGIFVLTPPQIDIQSHSAFQSQLGLWKDTFMKQYDVQIYSSWDLQQMESPSWRTPLVEMQIAACASAGFVGVQYSTVSRFIKKLRRDMDYACAE